MLWVNCALNCFIHHIITFTRISTKPGNFNKAFTKLFRLLICQQVVLELCRNDDFASPQAIQPHLSRINTYITNQDKEVGALVKFPSLFVSVVFIYMLFYFLFFFFKKTSSSEVKASVTNFLKLVHTLVGDQCQRDIFYQVRWLVLYHILSLYAV